ncbi:hypothetical protein R80B4_01515 [Fibrobacteres bacterium R8-0-B4]
MPENYYVICDGTTSAEQNFHKVTAYKEKEISAIADPQGGSSKKMPTAIPSPFARFDLVKTAFKNIALTGDSANPLRAQKSGTNVIASEDEERLVSYTLDLAELVYEHIVEGDTWQVLKWNKEEHLNKLSSGNVVRFKKAIDLYLNDVNDKVTYNFQDMGTLSLFRYKYKKTVGSTSPVTLFCPSEADLDEFSIQLLDGRTAFSKNRNDYKPLYDRSVDFQKWFHYMVDIAFIGDERIADVRSYVGVSRRISGNKNPEMEAIFTSISKIAQEIGSKPDDGTRKDEAKKRVRAVYDPFDSHIAVLGVEICHKSSVVSGVVFGESDFAIKSPKYEAFMKDNSKDALPYLPLALENKYPKEFRYLSANWITKTEVPLYEETSWKSARKMPGIGNVPGHYLTVSDFLEPYLIKTIYPISGHFYSRPEANKEGSGYLLPLKKDFFKFFDIADLKDGGEGKPQLTIVPQSDGVKVTLKVPIKKMDEYVKFERIYKNVKQRPNELVTDGGIILEKWFGVTIFPFVRTNGAVKPNYRVQIVDNDKSLNSECKLGFYSEKEEAEISADVKRRSKKNAESPASNYYKVDNEFDIIQLSVTDMPLACNALIVPNWPVVASTGTTKFTFAVDFGTTNTHIAYKKGDDDPKPFNVTGKDKDIQIATLFDETSVAGMENIMADSPEILEFIDKEFAPREIGAGSKSNTIFAFPQRTAISYSEDMAEEDWVDGLDALAEANIPFDYEKNVPQRGNGTETNLKWNNSDEEKDQKKTKVKMGAYLEEIVMLMQNKVLMNGGNLKDTRLIWFYPGSMDGSDVERLELQWKGYFEKYFRNGEKLVEGSDLVVAVLESLAPFYSQKGGSKPTDRGTVVSIDIGGGTTDVAGFIDGKLEGTTSFKFAGNALFGDGYEGKAANDNGFAIKYTKEYEKLLAPHRVPKAILNDLIKQNRAGDINAFLFSVENTIEHWAKTRNEKPSVDVFSYSAKLRDDRKLKFLVLYFYVAIIYHVAQILREIENKEGSGTIDLRYFMFSGTGSKILNILAAEKTLLKLTKDIIESQGIKTDVLNVSLVDSPKEATCNGGLKVDIKTIKEDMSKSESASKYVFTCVKGKEMEHLCYDDYTKNIADIEESLVNFHKFFFELNKKFDFKGKFGIPDDVIEAVEKEYPALLKHWVAAGIERNRKIEGIKPSSVVSETPFFMPLKSMILVLSKELVQ